MGFTWYIVKEDGTTQKLAATTSDVTPGTDGVYTCNAANMTVDPNGWTGLEANKTYNVLCVVSGKAPDGTSKWQTPMRGYKLQTLRPALRTQRSDSPTEGRRGLSGPILPITVSARSKY